MSAESKLYQVKSKVTHFEETIYNAWSAEESLYHQRAIQLQKEHIDDIILSISRLRSSISAAQRDIQREAEMRMRMSKK